MRRCLDEPRGWNDSKQRRKGGCKRGVLLWRGTGRGEEEIWNGNRRQEMMPVSHGRTSRAPRASRTVSSPRGLTIIIRHQNHALRY